MKAFLGKRVALPVCALVIGALVVAAVKSASTPSEKGDTNASASTTTTTATTTTGDIAAALALATTTTSTIVTAHGLPAIPTTGPATILKPTAPPTTTTAAPTTTPAATITPAPATTGAPGAGPVKEWVTVTEASGSGDKRTGEFHLTGGESRLRYTSTANGFFVYVVDASDSQEESSGGLPAVSCSDPCGDETLMVQGEGDYYLQVTASGGSWSVVVEQGR